MNEREPRFFEPWLMWFTYRGKRLAALLDWFRPQSMTFRGVTFGKVFVGVFWLTKEEPDDGR